jgi:hypothetical protein
MLMWQLLNGVHKTEVLCKDHIEVILYYFLMFQFFFFFFFFFWHVHIREGGGNIRICDFCFIRRNLQPIELSLGDF